MQHVVMARKIEQWTRGVGDTVTSIPNLTFFRREAPSEAELCLVEPSVVIVAQGVKQLFVGGEPYRYDTSRFLITSLELPAQSQVIEASAAEPCVGMTMKLDLRVMAELIVQGELKAPRDRATSVGVAVGNLTPGLLQPFERLVDLLDEPSAIPVLAPLIQREIHYRLLVSDQAARLWQIVAAGSQSNRIAMVINWLKANFSVPLKIEDLATRAQMSPTTFHQHFRELTTMSPLQYQKWLRLNEARRLMLDNHLDAATAAFRVGYESPSQFSREYGRHFGAPPKRDIEEIRRQLEQSGR